MSEALFPDPRPTLVATPTGNSRPKGNTRRRTRLNTALTWALLLLLVLSPLPLASARPIFWGLSAAYLGVIGAIYIGSLTAIRETVRVPASWVTPETIVFATFCTYLLVQALPLGNLFGNFLVVHSFGYTISMPQISIAPILTLVMLVKHLSFALLFWLMMQAGANEARRSRIFSVLMFSALVYAGYALIALQSGDTLLGIPKWAYEGSATGPFVNRNSFATFLGFGAIITAGKIGGLIHQRGQRHGDDGRVAGNISSILLYSIAFALLVITILATQSRMGLFGTLLGTVVVAGITLAHVGTRRSHWVAMVAVLVVMALALLYFGQGLLVRLGTVEESANVRGELYEQILQLIQTRPWTGYGGGTFELAYPLFHAEPVNIDLVWRKAHNTYLSLWSELGWVFGSLPILAAALVLARLSIALAKGRGDWRAQAIACGAITLAAVHSLVDFSLEIQANALLFVAILAIGVATTSDFKRSED